MAFDYLMGALWVLAHTLLLQIYLVVSALQASILSWVVSHRDLKQALEVPGVAGLVHFGSAEIQTADLRPEIPIGNVAATLLKDNVPTMEFRAIIKTLLPKNPRRSLLLCWSASSGLPTGSTCHARHSSTAHCDQW